MRSEHMVAFFSWYMYSESSAATPQWDLHLNAQRARELSLNNLTVCAYGTGPWLLLNDGKEHDAYLSQS